MKLHRYEGNPILSPNPANPWEDLAATSVIMNFTWYDKLDPGEMYLPEDE